MGTVATHLYLWISFVAQNTYKESNPNQGRM